MLSVGRSTSVSNFERNEGRENRKYMENVLTLRDQMTDEKVVTVKCGNGE